MNKCDEMRGFLIVVCLIIAGFILKPAEASEIDPNTLGKILIDSELIYCEDNICTYYYKSQKPLQHSNEFPDGYHVIFPAGIATREEIESAKPHVVEFWTNYIDEIQYK